VLNTLFGAVTACVTAHGGDVLRIAGDALICCWPLSDEQPDAANDAATACAAAACALAMLALPELEACAGNGLPPVALHVALHCGQLTELHVGNGDEPGGRWEHMVTGAALSELAPLIAAAAPGECVASDALWALLGEDASAARGAPCAGGAHLALQPHVSSTRGHGYLSNDDSHGHCVPPLSDEALAGLGCYLPPALANALETGGHGWMAELRYVSVLFTSLPPCGAEDFALAQACVAEIHRCLDRHGGVPQQSLSDDKGTVSIGVFGTRAGDLACVFRCVLESNIHVRPLPQVNRRRAMRTTPAARSPPPSSWRPACAASPPRTAATTPSDAAFARGAPSAATWAARNGASGAWSATS
jgi:hypothetical protein